MTMPLIPPEELMLAPGLVHLQTGGVGAMPKSVFDATVAAMREVESDPARETYGPGVAEFAKVRAKIASLIGADAEDIVLTTSATQSMFMLAQGLHFTHGDHVLTTDHEHPGGRLGWEWAARRYGIEVDAVPIAPDETDPKTIVERFADRILPRTRLISISHILFTTGVKLPVAELCALARDHGCLAIVDGAQGPGAMPVDVKALNCHAYAASGHKWLLGPKGTGFLYISPEISGALDALQLAAGRVPGSDSTGIVNIGGLRGLGAAVDYVAALDPKRIDEHNMSLRRELYDRLSRFNPVSIPAPADGPLNSANLSFCLPDGADLAAIRRNLVMKHKIYIRTVDQAGFKGLRASMHAYNGSADIARLVEALTEELA
ncbi:aminotransferase class V-fold PLP-dependent enzyme [Sphingomonas alba]|uniref:Aminotransferase class V-fold PLP-dependent enzyme n=1 Tax=Sphingomonas alba TaxID=2908208 RepID=A0ABT0RK76_9SPHN|nr:aminotransferase class V-fold PLP-dependent enzyme [Sphingomonas alba]MCL6683044.1 aminotransferase class V-fold PLP-dependent enzyme [Sphingomonas alba]